jgi:tetratricopeptide (TPR) repeat protein
MSSVGSRSGIDHRSRNSIQLAIVVTIILLLMTSIVYSPLRSQKLTMWDDPVYVTVNPYVTNGITSEGIKWAFTTSLQANYHPLTWLSLMLDAELFGNRPWGYKLTNVALHLLSTILLLLTLWLASSRFWPSFFVAALFALHPLHVESVAWVSERKDVLSTTFVLGSMACYVMYAKRLFAGWYAGFIILFAMSLLSKQMYVTLPALLLLIDVWPMRRWQSLTAPVLSDLSFPHVSLPRLLLEKALPLAMALIAALRIYTLQTPDSSAKHITFSLAERIANAAVAYAWYLEKTFVPIDLSFFYPFPTHGYADSTIALAVGILLFTTVLAIIFARRMPFLLVGWLWYTGTLIPVIGIVQVGYQAYADRYTYFPLIGIFIAIVWTIATIGSMRPRLNIALSTLGFAVLAVLGFLSHRQALTWNDTKSMALHAIAIDPTNHQANALLAYEAFADHQWKAAEKYSEASVRAPDVPATNYLNYGVSLLCLGKIDEAKKVFEKTMAFNLPHDGRSEYQLGILAAGRGELETAADLLAKAQRAAPNPNQAFSLSIVLARLGRLEEASQILASTPKYNSEVRLASELIKQMSTGDENAKRRFKRIFDWPVSVQASRLRAANVEAAVSMKLLTPKEGLDELQTALKMWHNNIDAMIQMALILSREQKNSEAKTMLYRVLEIDPKNESANKLLGRNKSS